MSTTPVTFDLTAHGLTVATVHHNLPASALYEHAIRFEKDASIAENGALIAYSGVTSVWSSIPTRRTTSGGDR
jgi:phosphoenolpyruvate carboxykinase (ATP)